MTESIRDGINAALKQAIKAQDKRSMATLRLITAAIKDRDIALRGGGNRDGVSDQDLLGIMAKMIKQREESSRTYEDAGRLELATQEREEIEVIRRFLPEQLDDAALGEACRAVVKELDATGLKDMGPTMAALKERYAGQMDFGKASALVKELLG